MFPVQAFPPGAFPGGAFPPGAQAAHAILATSIALRYTVGYGLADLTPARAWLDAGPARDIVLSGGHGLEDATPERNLVALSPPDLAPSEAMDYDLRDVTPHRDLVGASPHRALAPVGGYEIEDSTVERTVRQRQ